MYKIADRLGYKNGNILEPSMGTGNFFGLIPDSMSRSRLYGVELDPITGNIAKLLYPNAAIQIKGYQDTNYPDNFFDLAIGNVPFANVSVRDPSIKDSKLRNKLHDFFFVKTLDKVKPGGLIMFISSTGTWISDRHILRMETFAQSPKSKLSG